MTGPPFVSRLEVVGNIRAVARRICQSGRNERLEAHDMQRRNKICARWNVLCWIGNRSAHNKRHACQHCHFRMKHIQMFAITRMDAERNERSRSEKTSNFFWVHISNLPDSLRFLNAQSGRRRLAKVCGVRGVGGQVVEHGVDGGRDRLELGEAGEDRAIADFAVD